MTNVPVLGNDLVDLTEPLNCQKQRDQRFLQRVFTPHEQALILSNADPNRCLWKFWAAKEAAFKALARTEPHLVFAHQRFEIAPHSRTQGEVHWYDRLFVIDWQESPEWVHAIVHSNALDPNDRLWAIEPCFGSESMAVRQLASQLAEVWGWTKVTIEGRPPLAFCQNQRLPLTVSLSHDGRWIAACLAR